MTSLTRSRFSWFSSKSSGYYKRPWEPKGRIMPDIGSSHSWIVWFNQLLKTRLAVRFFLVWWRPVFFFFAHLYFSWFWMVFFFFPVFRLRAWVSFTWPVILQQSFIRLIIRLVETAVLDGRSAPSWSREKALIQRRMKFRRKKIPSFRKTSLNPVFCLGPSFLLRLFGGNRCYGSMRLCFLHTNLWIWLYFNDLLNYAKIKAIKKIYTIPIL